MIVQSQRGFRDTSSELNTKTTVLLVLAVVFVCLRFWARRIKRATYWADDWMIVVALGFIFALGGLNYASIAYGLGRHTDTLPISHVVIFFKILLAIECIYITAVMLVKLSLLLMYRRVFPFPEFSIYLGIIAGLVISWWIAIVTVCIFQCTPVSKAWLPWKEGTCIDLKASFIGNIIPNVLTDIAILCMPIKPVWKLQATLAKRLSLCFIFLLGSFAMFASIYRSTTIKEIDLNDITWTLSKGITWAFVEVVCGAISACLPTLPPLLVMTWHEICWLTGLDVEKSQANNENPDQSSLTTIGGGKWGKAHGKLFHRLHDDEAHYGSRSVLNSSALSNKETIRKDSESIPSASIKHTIDMDIELSELQMEIPAKYFGTLRSWPDNLSHD